MSTSTHLSEAGIGAPEVDFRGVFDNAPDIVTQFDRGGRVLYVNRAIEQVTGMTRESILGRTHAELRAPLDHCAMWTAAIERVVSSRASQQIEFEVPALDRTRRFHSFLMPELDPAGEVLSVLAICRDVTELCRGIETAAADAVTAAERQRLAIFREARDAMLITDDERRYVDVNPAACELFGISREQLLGRRIDDICGGGEDVDVDAMWRQFRETRSLDGEFPVRRHDGTSRTVKFRAIADFVPGRHLSILRDITERKQEAERLRAEAVARAQAEAATRAKDEFLATLGHELRNPLAPIMMALEAMNLDESPHFEQERRLIERHVRHLALLVDDILDISRITQGQLVLRRERVEIATIVAKALEMTTPLLAQRQHHAETRLPHGGLIVDGDPARLAQVLANLLTNAAKYTPPRGHIVIAVEREGGEVVMRVRDNGSGIRADLLPRVFELFVQDRSQLDRASGGLGIGLCLVRRLVEMHGGTVGVTSEVGRGSEFTVRLPGAAAAAAAAVPAPALAAAEPWPPNRHAEPIAERERVLIVDDNVDAADALAILLGLVGYTTRVAYDGATALELAGVFRPQIAMLDIGLPVMDGYELAQRLRREPGLERLQVIVITGYGMESDLARSREAGIDIHLVKPVDLKLLRHALAAKSA